MKALGYVPPLFAHAPMILGEDGSRLSKRHGAVSVIAYREIGILPNALKNYLLRLGWSHGDQELFTEEEMIELFSLDAVNGAASAFSLEKLNWVNQQHIKTRPTEELLPEFLYHAEQLELNLGPDQQLVNDVIDAQRDRANNMKHMVEDSRFYFEDVTSKDEKAVDKHFNENTANILSVVKEHLNNADWNSESVMTAIKSSCEALELKMGKVGPALRIALLGTASSPSLDVTLLLIGKERSIQRLEQTIVELA